MAESGNNKKKVMLLVDGLDITNGVSITCMELAKNWDKVNSNWYLHVYGSTIIKLKNKRYRNADIRSNMGLIKMPVLGYTGMWLSIPINALFKILFMAKYDIIHVATPGPLGALGVFMARTLHKPLICTHHTRMVDYLNYYSSRSFLPIVKKLAYWFFKYLYSHSRITIVHSPPAGEEAKELGAKQVKYIPMGVYLPYTDLDQLISEKKRARERLNTLLRTDPDKPVILYVGRISKEKNILRLAEASNYLPYNFVFVGGGPLKSELSKYKNVIVAGFRYKDELRDIYLASDMLVSASTSETLGKIFLEALSHGTPIIVPDKGHHNSVLSEESPSIHKFKSGDFKSDVFEIKEAIDKLLNSGTDKFSLTKSAFDYAYSFSWEKVIADHIAPYDEVISRRYQ